MYLSWRLVSASALLVLSSLSSLFSLLLLSAVTHWFTSFSFLDLLFPFSVKILVSSSLFYSFTLKFPPQSWFPPLSFLSQHNPGCRCDSCLICIWKRLPASRNDGSITRGKGERVSVLFWCVLPDTTLHSLEALNCSQSILDAV